MAKRARDAEEIKRKKMARLRFGNLIRSVAINRIWLVDSSDQKFSLNVKKNISMLVRTQRKIGLLTMAEKSLIRTHYQLRTIEDRKKLVSLMAGLNCFNKIPPKIRARLARCVKFMVIGPGRILIKEGGSPMMLYFLLTGEVEVSKRVYDHILKSYVNKIKTINGSGDCLGDVEMIERCARKNTYTSISVVELLVVFEEDFEQILRPVMEQQWIDKKNAIMALDYFKFFTKDQVTDASKLCVLRQFEPLETICYEDKSQLSYVHFVISGECMILQCLQMMVSQTKGVKNYYLTDISKEGASSVFQDIADNQISQIFKSGNNATNNNIYDIDQLIASDNNIRQSASMGRNNKHSNIKRIEKMCGIISNSSSTTENFTSASYSKENLYSEINKEEDIESEEKECSQAHSHKLNLSRNTIGSDNLGNNSIAEDFGNGKDEKPTNSNKIKLNLKVIKNKEFLKSESAENEPLNSEVRQLSIQSKRSSNPFSVKLSYKPSDGKIENHFIDVGSLTFGSIFGLGEKLEHRVIMARTTVQCLMIPRFWLLEKDQNPGNIWQRRRFYLDTTIPSRHTLFNDFLNTRQWQKFKSNLIQSNLNQNSISNPTHVEDIPIICRIVEASDE